MNLKITRSSDPNSIGERINIEIIMEKALGEYVNGDMMREIAKQLTTFLVEELKPNVSRAIKENMQQIVKDVGSDITIAGLRHLLKVKKKNENKDNR